MVKRAVMTTRLFRICLFCVLALSCSSCFEIIEDMTLKADGSGTLEYRLNASQSATNLRSLMALDSINGQKVPDKAQIEAEIAKLVKQFDDIDGFSNVQTSTDFDNFIFSFKFDFSSVAALDKGLVAFAQKLDKDNKLEGDIPSDNFRMDAKTFYRKGLLNPAQGTQLQGEAENILKQATFRAIYKFAQPIAGVSNADAVISPSGKAVMLKYSLYDLFSSSKTIENTVTFK